MWIQLKLPSGDVRTAQLSSEGAPECIGFTNTSTAQLSGVVCRDGGAAICPGD